MSFITFDITFKKRTDFDSLKMVLESEFNQLKLIICGKYKIYDLSSCLIYMNNELLSYPETTKLKDIFKKRKVKLTIQIEKKTSTKSQPISKYNCKCKSGAKYVCDKCDEFLCESCSKRSKHNIHLDKVIKIEEYNTYLKNYLHKSAIELDEKIIKDEAYKYYCYWSYDLTNELSAINQCYEFAKKELEDIKQIQIDTLIALSNTSKFVNFTSDMETLIKAYTNINTQENLINMLVDKTKLIDDSNDMIRKFSELKQAVLCYNNTLKDLQSFNQNMLNEIKERFLFTKKKYLGTCVGNNSTSNINNNSNNTNTHYVNNYQSNNTSFNSIVFSNQGNTLNTIQANNSFNNSNSNPNHNNTTMNNINVNLSLNTPINNCPQMNTSFQRTKQNSYRPSETYNPNHTIIHEKLLLKLKDQRKILAFLTHSQTFKEKVFIDSSNFKSHMTNESDITQLNHNNKLYMITGNNYNKVFYYDYSSNAVYYLNTTLNPHYYGALIYSASNNALYLIGGNNTTKCEIYQLSNLNSSLQNNTVAEWKNIPELNEERQEFGSLYVNNCIYVFFGFSPFKGYNLSTIEKYNVDIPDSRFEIIYVNEQIKLSSIACAKYKENEIFLIGGFDGRNYVDTSLIFNPKTLKIRDSQIQIPNMNKHFQFLFQKESAFVSYDGYQVLFDMKNNAHMLSNSTYEVFSEIK